MNKKKIAIISVYYPYGKGETFLHNEVIFLSKYFDIHLFPLLKETNKGKTRVIPLNVTVHAPFLVRNYYKRLFYGIFNLSLIIPYLKDLNVLVRNSTNIRKSIFQWFMSLITYRIIISSKRFKSIFKNNFDIVYFYWGNFPVKFIKGDQKIFIRVHGGEVDFERSNNYIPLVKQNIIKKDNITYLPISNKSNQSIVNIYTANTVINRLGVYDKGLNFGIKESDISIRIVSCSNLIPLKRIHLIVNALQYIKDKKIEWIHFGDGPLMQKILSLSESLPKNIKVDFKGRVDNALVLEYYKQNYIDLFINVSEVEGVPVSIMEAFSFGIPCFATDVGGTKEIVNDNNGFLVKKSFNIIELKNIVVDIRRLSIKNNLRKHARQTWKNLYNADKNFYDLVKLFQK